MVISDAYVLPNSSHKTPADPPHGRSRRRASAELSRRLNHHSRGMPRLSSTNCFQSAATAEGRKDVRVGTSDTILLVSLDISFANFDLI